MVGRAWTLLLLLYIGADFIDPSVSGVFFLDNEALFVDSVVHAKGSVRALAPPEPDARPSAAVVVALSPMSSPTRPAVPGSRAPSQAPPARRSLSPPAPPPAVEDH